MPQTGLFVRVPLDFIASPAFTDMPPRVLKLYLALHRYRDHETGLCWPSRAELARVLGVSEWTVSATVTAAHKWFAKALGGDFQLVKRERTHGGTRLGKNIYLVPDFANVGFSLLRKPLLRKPTHQLTSSTPISSSKDLRRTDGSFGPKPSELTVSQIALAEAVADKINYHLELDGDTQPLIDPLVIAKGFAIHEPGVQGFDESCLWAAIETFEDTHPENFGNPAGVVITRAREFARGEREN